MTHTAASDPLCLNPRGCPISGTPCPGECVFANVLQTMQPAILLFDLQARSIFFRNQAAGQFLARIGTDTFEELCGLLGGPEGSLDSPGARARDSQVLRVGASIFGYSIYHAGRFAWVFLRDITERTRLEALAGSIEWTNSLGYIFSTVRHELGNPVNSVKTALSVLSGGLDRFSKETIQEYIQGIQGEMSRVEQLLQTLKSFSAHERPDCQPRDLAAFLQGFSPLVERDLAQGGIRLTIEAEPGLPLVSMDPRGLNQVLINLVANAIDALQERHSPQIWIRARQEGGGVSVLVEDNGSGIRDQDMHRLFTPFFTTKVSGTGLGLVIVKKMLAEMGSTIHAEQRIPCGTRIQFNLEPA
ncbi:MAG: HAMP domain-containing histidine kinase [Acidobacteria bacterium]|nr:HAMP domain-containing histidine kinase [Acidobacteriota bacterium]